MTFPDSTALLVALFYGLSAPIIGAGLWFLWKAGRSAGPGNCPICHNPGPEGGHEDCKADWSIR